MKKLFYLLFFTQIITAQNAFDQANLLYKKGNYEEASQVYENILRAKKHSAELYFNLGNCYFKMNKVAPAIYNFERALLLNPTDVDVQNNLRFAQKLQIDDIKEVPKVGFNKMLQDITSKYHYNTWAWIAVGLSVLFLLFFIGYYFSGYSVKKRLFFVGMFLVLIGILTSIASALFEKKLFDENQPAIVFAEITTVKAEPKQQSADVFVLHEGSKVQILETVDNWQKIEIADGKKGWILQSVIKKLK
jgi:tetratricopeptide (TPR) repeat protein